MEEAMGKILIIDDEVALRRLIAEELQNHGYETVVASRFEEAEAILERGDIDLVILDLRLDRESGFDFLPSILAQERRIKVVIHTAYPTYKRDFRSWGADAFIIKRSDLSELLGTVRKLMPRPRQQTAV